jgi:hypothetical protein
MFDVFYSGPKPNLFVHEREARDIAHARSLSRTRLFWWINYLTDYTGFDFLYEPVPWQTEQCHVWPSQHQTDGGTRLVPKNTAADTNYDHPVVPRKAGAVVVGIDHGTGIEYPCATTTRYIADYLGTLQRLLRKVDAEWCWVISSECDYSTFDFTWHPSEWQTQMLHVFASDDQRFGDTFYVHVPSFLEQTKKLALLEWYDTINFVPDIRIPRKDIPVIVHNQDSQVNIIKDYNFDTPVAMFTQDNNIIKDNIIIKNYPTVNLWREEEKKIAVLSSGAGTIIVPRETKNYLTTQLYDYPYIDRSQQHLYSDKLLDIVFIDNNESNADYNYEHLKNIVSKNNNKNKIHRSSGVNGRVAAYRAAAELSRTPWFFAVFAKLKIDPVFDWAWQPDRLQEAKHYIFHAVNPVNALVYGHQAMIAYNKQLVLSNTAPGLDFTLDQAHEVVPIVSGTANYHTDAWSCWRTAFRECVKLRDNTDVESQYRLRQWLTKDTTAEQWSRKGAEDAVEYYDSVNGNFTELKKSYDWAWLASYALLKRNLTPSQ